MTARVANKGETSFFNVSIQKMTGTIIDPNGDGKSRIKDDRIMVYDVGGNNHVGYKVLPNKDSVLELFDFHTTDQPDPRIFSFIN